MIRASVNYHKCWMLPYILLMKCLEFESSMSPKQIMWQPTWSCSLFSSLSLSLCVFLLSRVGCAHSFTLPHPLSRTLTLEHSNTLIFALCEQFQQHCSHCIGFSKLLLLLFNSPANDILSCAFCQPFASAFGFFSSLLVSATWLLLVQHKCFTFSYHLIASI